MVLPDSPMLAESNAQCSQILQDNIQVLLNMFEVNEQNLRIS